MTSRRFQSGHEVMVTFVKDYSAPPRREPVYHDVPSPVLSGQQLGKELLADLREALTDKNRSIRSPETAP